MKKHRSKVFSMTCRTWNLWPNLQTHILVQAEDELLLIDQHALHERIRYERLRHSGQAWEPQQRLSPLLSTSTQGNQRWWMHITGALKNSVSTYQTKRGPGTECLTPTSWRRPDQTFLLDLLQDLALDGGPLETIEAKGPHRLHERMSGSVKANESLSLPEMRRLIDDMRRIQNPWACVHGRPTSLRISIDSLDHHFGRHG